MKDAKQFVDSVFDIIERRRQEVGYYENLKELVKLDRVRPEMVRYNVGDIVRLKSDATLKMRGFNGEDVVVLSVRDNFCKVKLLNSNDVCDNVRAKDIDCFVGKIKIKKISKINIDKILNSKLGVKQKINKLVEDFGLHVFKINSNDWIRPYRDGLEVALNGTSRKSDLDLLVSLLIW